MPADDTQPTASQADARNPSPRQHIVTTATLAERRRFAAWQEISHQFGITVEPDRRGERSFDGRVRMVETGPLVHVRSSSSIHKVSRTQADVLRIRRGSYALYRERSEGARIEHGGHETLTRRGDLVVMDMDTPFQSQTISGFAQDIWVLPKTFLAPHLPRLERPLSMTLTGRDGVDAIIGAYLGTMMRQAPAMNVAVMDSIADTLGRLVGIACGAAAAAHPDAMRAGHLARAQRYIERHLAEPGLSPASAAAALGLSVRQLHQVFVSAGESFAATVQRLRLTECRRALTGPTGAHRSVADIAFGWGFGSLRTFHRVYQAAFGMTPGEDREAAARATVRE